MVRERAARGRIPLSRKGLFITFEGIEGSGKSTQIRRLAAWLRGRGLSCVVTREPGGTRAGDAIRAIFLGPSGHGLDPWTELLLVEAARAQHLARVVRPALRAGRVVLCDRYTDSTLAYQGYGRGIPPATIRSVHRLPALATSPDVTLLLDLPVRDGLARAGGRNAATRGGRRGHGTRLDEEPAAFHGRVRRGFLALARREPRRIVTIVAAGSPLDVARRVRDAIGPHLPPHASTMTRNVPGAGRPSGRRSRRRAAGTRR